jgi:hypothetical protein
MSDSKKLQEILTWLGQTKVEYNDVLVKVRNRLAQVKEARAALATMRERLKIMREPITKYENSTWDMCWNGEIPKDVATKAEADLRDFNRRLDDLIWELFDFRP